MSHHHGQAIQAAVKNDDLLFGLYFSESEHWRLACLSSGQEDLLQVAPALQWAYAMHRVRLFLPKPLGALTTGCGVRLLWMDLVWKVQTQMSHLPVGHS